MKNLKKAMAAAGMSVAVAGSALAFTPSVTPVEPNLSDDEKVTIKLFQDFQACVTRKTEELNTKVTAYAETAKQQADKIASARSAAGDAATLEAMKDLNLTSEEQSQVLNILKNGETNFFAQILVSKMMSQEKNPGEACVEELKINTEEAGQKIRQIVEKHGPGVLLAPQ